MKLTAAFINTFLTAPCNLPVARVTQALVFVSVSCEIHLVKKDLYYSETTTIRRYSLVYCWCFQNVFETWTWKLQSTGKLNVLGREKVKVDNKQIIAVLVDTSGHLRANKVVSIVFTQGSFSSARGRLGTQTPTEQRLQLKSRYLTYTGYCCCCCCCGHRAGFIHKHLQNRRC